MAQAEKELVTFDPSTRKPYKVKHREKEGNRQKKMAPLVLLLQFQHKQHEPR